MIVQLIQLVAIVRTAVAVSNAVSEKLPADCSTPIKATGTIMLHGATGYAVGVACVMAAPVTVPIGIIMLARDGAKFAARQYRIRQERKANAPIDVQWTNVTPIRSVCHVR